MPTNVDGLRTLMEQGNSTGHQMLWKPNERGDGFDLKIDTETYTNRYGDHSLIGLVRLMDNGPSISIEAPTAFHVPVGDAGSISEFCLRHQMKVPQVRFALDQSDGELRPLVQQVLGAEALDHVRLTVMMMLLIGACEELGSVLAGTGPLLDDDGER